MTDIESPEVGPAPDEFGHVFHVYEVRTDGDRLLYYGEPLVDRERLVEEIWADFRAAGYEVRLTRQTGEFVLLAEPRSEGMDGIPWTNVILAFATVLTTLYAGSIWYHADLAANPLNVLQGWPFTVGIMTVLGVHEFGHYAMSRYHDVEATLPYFIPIPTFIGTLGAVIRMKGRMPSRKALFDIGVAGPLAGIAATVAVTTIGLYLPPVTVPETVVNSQSAVQIQFGFPLLLEFLSMVTGQPLRYADPATAVNPVVIAGWVGMFVTFLNLIPVGQLDGGHVVRAIVGRQQERVAAIVPALLFGLAGYLYYFENVAGNAVFLWVFWGLFASVFAFVGAATPVEDESLDPGRKLVGILTLVVGLLCFHPIPIQIIG